MRCQRPSAVLSSAFRKSNLSLAKTCSMGFRSGEYEGRKSKCAPAALIMHQALSPLWLVRLSMITTSRGLSVGHQNLFDTGLESHSVDRAIKNKRCGDPVAAKGCQEGRCLPVAIGQFGQEGLAPGAPAMGSGHVGLCPGFINEHKAAGLE